MMDSSDTRHWLKVLCQSVDDVGTSLLDNSPATAAQVRATSAKLSSILLGHWGRRCSKEGSIPADQLLVSSTMPSSLLAYLNGSLHDLARDLLEDSTPCVNMAAWTSVQNALQDIVSSGLHLASEQSTKAAALGLVQQGCSQ
jgi:hypothetical protein